MFDFLADLALAPFNCVLWLLVGFIAGAGARRIMQAPNYPFIQDVILGILGAVVGAFILGFVAPDVYRTGGLNLVIVNLVVATIGACLLIALRRMFTGKAKN
jgi:uncharacterized membrane protein YeaQ/YmgE (transglycosylase-associated protein family)